jgi:hypothetical protein
MRESIPALSVAVFGTFLTSTSIIAAFSIEKESRWPTFWEALRRAHVPLWFLVGLASVVAALLAVGFDCDQFRTLSLVLAIAAVPLGTWALWGLISLSSEQGRWNLVVDLLADSILRVQPPSNRVPADLGEIHTEDHVPASFLNAGELRRPRRTGVSIEQVQRVLGEYADRRELEAIVRLVDEVHAGACAALGRAGSLEFDQYRRSVDYLLHVQRSIFSELANRVLAGQLGDATARIAVLRAGLAALDTAGRARQVKGGDDWDREEVELIVGRHLAALARFAGHVSREVDAQLGLRSTLFPQRRAPTAERGGALALRTAVVELQQAVRWAVDPDPPGMKLPAEHPWRSGLTSPEAVLVWLWSTVESASGPFGVALYASCQILTGEKFWESYWDGFDVFTEVARRLAEGNVPGPVAEAIRRCGGLEMLALELGATRLAATPPRRPGEPAFEGDPARRDDRHVACDLFLAAAGFKPPGRDPVADLARLLSDRPAGSLWTTVLEDLCKLPDDVVLPSLQPLYRHPEACALAIALRLAPLGEVPDAKALAPLKDFVSTLPDPLLERTAKLGAGLVSGEGAEGTRANFEERLIESVRFARFITPGMLPPQQAEGEPSGAFAVAVPPELEKPGFEAALDEISGSRSMLQVDLVQLDQRWLGEWAELRSVLDAELLAAALRGTAQIRRVVLYDLPGYAAQETTRLHYRWTESLATASRCFPRQDGWRSSYEVRQVLATRFGSVEEMPRDAIFVRPLDETSASSFEELWRDREGGLIEL